MATTSSNSKEKGGYDFEFVTTPPKFLECPVCLLILRDPHVISCCGNEFCQLCIQRVQIEGKPCPLCNAQEFTTFLHKKLVHEVNGLVVCCPQKAQGCEWEGELGQLQLHLTNPGAGQDLRKGCLYVMVACPLKCGVEIPRCLLAEHESEACPKRPIDKQIASLAQKVEAVVTNNQLLRQALSELQKSHHKLQYRLQQVEQMYEKDLREMKQVINEVKEENEKLKKECLHQESEHKNTLSLLETKKATLSVPPFYFALYNFRHSQSINYVWFSDPFYSHPGGYKMVIIVYPNGFGSKKGTHVSLYACLQRGEFDDQLEWPFNGRITVEVYNFTAKEWSKPTIIKLDKDASKDAIRRPTTFRNGSWGFPDYLSHDELCNHYIKRHDFLSMRVVCVETV